jgi:hypothetical protein
MYWIEIYLSHTPAVPLGKHLSFLRRQFSHATEIRGGGQIAVLVLGGESIVPFEYNNKLFLLCGS